LPFPLGLNVTVENALLPPFPLLEGEAATSTGTGLALLGIPGLLGWLGLHAELLGCLCSEANDDDEEEAEEGWLIVSLGLVGALADLLAA